MCRRPPFAILLFVLLTATPAASVPLRGPQEPEEEAAQETVELDADSEQEEGESGRTKEERKERRKERKERKAAAGTEAESDTTDAEEHEGEDEDRGGDEAQDSASEAESVESDAGSDSEEDSESGEERDSSSDSDAGSDSDSSSDDDSDSDSDSDRPAQLLISTDAECHLFVDGRSEGVLEPGEELAVGVDLGDIDLRASSVEVTRAVWEKTLEFEEEGQVETIRVRMKKAVRQMRQQERSTGVFRDRKTSLMWVKRDNGRDVDLRGAYNYCRDLDVGGYDGWRLPTLAELESLEAVWQRAAYKIHGDIVLSECCMWSTDYDGSEKAWTLNYRFRKAFETNAGYKLGLRALCVRNWDPDLEGESEDDGAEDAEDAEGVAEEEAEALDGAEESVNPPVEEGEDGG